METIIWQLAKLLFCTVGAAATTWVANTQFNQHWSFWIVFIAWLIVVFIGVVLIKISDGDLELW